MVYIKSISVEGLVGRKDIVHLDFKRDLNILWGLNGSGKTSLLRIINSALRNDSSLCNSVPFEKAIVDFYSTYHELPIRRWLARSEDSRPDLGVSLGELSYEGIQFDPPVEGSVRMTQMLKGGVSQEWNWKTEPETINSEVYRGAFHRVYLPTTRLSTPARRPGHATLGPGDIDKDFADQITLLWNRYNSTSLASIDILRQKLIASILAAILSQKKGHRGGKSLGVSPEVAYDLVRQYLKSQNLPVHLGRKVDFLERYEDDHSLQEVVAEIVDVQAQVDSTREPQRTIEMLLAKFYSRDKKVSFQPGGIVISLGEKRIPLIGLSSGERQVLYILLECLSSQGGLVIVDEPELSMHVDWQNELVAAMQAVAPKSQLILATHSPEIMADVPDNRIFHI